MSEAGGVRIGDAERQAVIDLLRRHTGEGRLTLDEFAERAGEVYAAVTREDLAAVLADLPQGVRPEPPPGGASPARPPTAEPAPSAELPPATDPTATPRRGGTPRRRFIAVMSGSEAKGAWRAPESISAFAFWGGVDIDLRNALIESSVVEIEAWAIMGGVTVTVPPGIPVDVDGFILMGGITNRVRGDEPPIPGAPLIRIKARGMWGGVTVRNPSRRGALRRARQQIRDEMRAGRHQMRHDLRHSRDEMRDRRRSGRDPSQLAEEALDIARRAIDRALPPPSTHDRIPPMPGEQREARAEPAARSGRDANAAQNAANQAANAAQNPAAAPTPPTPPAAPAPPPTPPTPTPRTPPTPPTTPPAPAPTPPGGVETALPRIPTGTLTIMVSDIVGSTQMAERLGDQSWLDVLQEHNAIVRQQVSDHGGTEVKAQGDGFLVVFPSARSAVLAAIAIQREMVSYDHDHLDGDPVAVRVGLHTGEVVAVDGDVFGQNVVVASRIAAVADPGDIFVSGLTHDLTVSSSDLGFEPGKEVDLKGMSAPWRVHRVIWS